MRQRTARAILRIIPGYFTLDRRIFYLKRGSKIKLHKEVNFGKSKICINKTEKPFSPTLPDDIPKYSIIFQNIPDYSKIFQDIPKYSRLFQNIPEHYKIFWNITKYSRILQNIPEYY